MMREIGVLEQYSCFGILSVELISLASRYTASKYPFEVSYILMGQFKFGIWEFALACSVAFGLFEALPVRWDEAHALTQSWSAPGVLWILKDAVLSERPGSK